MNKNGSLNDPSIEEGFLLESQSETVLRANGDYRYVFEYDDDNKKGKQYKLEYLLRVTPVGLFWLRRSIVVPMCCLFEFA